MADFFIRRPIVAIVASIVITLLGVAVLQRLSIEQYPELSPPTIRVETTYQGASAEVVEQSVATPIEQQVNGVDNMIYMKSLNTSDGRMLLDISFQVGMDRDMANVLAQNRVSQAQSRLPQEVMQQGVTVKKLNPSILMVVSLYSPKGSRDAQFLNNYAMINIRDALLRDPGHAQERIPDVDHRVVVEELRVSTPLRRVERDHHQDAGVELLDRDALLHHFLRQPGLRLRHAVLREHVRHVAIHADLKRDVEQHAAVARLERLHVDHVVDAVHLLLDRRGNGLFHHLGGGTLVGGFHS